MHRIDSSPVLAESGSVLRHEAPPRLILASASQVRLSLLRDAGVAVLARPASIDEAAVKSCARRGGASAADTALLLADRKARTVVAPDALVIGADQILVCEERWFDKPCDLAEARTQLLALCGRPHVLHTAIALFKDAEPVWQHVAHPRLTMRAFSEAALDAYLALEGDRVLASVGAYRLEGPGVQLFDAIDGEHAAILGLPLLALLAFLRRQGVMPT